MRDLAILSYPRGLLGDCLFSKSPIKPVSVLTDSPQSPALSPLFCYEHLQQDLDADFAWYLHFRLHHFDTKRCKRKNDRFGVADGAATTYSLLRQGGVPLSVIVSVMSPNEC